MAERRRTKKLINAPDDVIPELIEGMAGAHPDILRIAGGSRRALVAVDGPRPGKVGIVIGGGSGHEPAFSGYVGRGLADACAVGNVFASPPPDVICDAARAADGGAGLLFLYGNYTGDVMNFDMAAEQLGREGLDVRSVQTTDDVASAPAERKAERRGIAGNFFVFKLGSAAADKGHSLDEVEGVAHHANASTASMGVALGPCSLPQTRVANFEIGDDEMEVGMGIHGEPGIARIPLEPADAVADRLLDPILSELSLHGGERVAVLVNGLGSTSLMELYILHRRVRAVLAGRGIEIYRSWVGPYVTSLEMAGASVSLLRLDDALTELLDHPCRTPALQVGSSPSPLPPARTGELPAAAAVRAASPTEPADRRKLLTTGEITPAVFRAMLRAAAARIHAEADRLSELDGVIGDGDHGITMDTGWRAIMAALDRSRPDATIAELSRAMSDAFLKAVGASAGPLYATGFTEASDAVHDRLNLDANAFVSWLEGVAGGIRRRGGAEAGDKTMVDAWDPAVEAARRMSDAGANLRDCLHEAVRAAREGAEATAGMEAKRGRSAKLGARSLGHVDAGAASAVVILEAFAAIASGNPQAPGGE